MVTQNRKIHRLWEFWFLTISWQKLSLMALLYTITFDRHLKWGLIPRLQDGNFKIKYIFPIFLACRKVHVPFVFWWLFSYDIKYPLFSLLSEFCPSLKYSSRFFIAFQRWNRLLCYSLRVTIMIIWSYTGKYSTKYVYSWEQTTRNN